VTVGELFSLFIAEKEKRKSIQYASQYVQHGMNLMALLCLFFTREEKRILHKSREKSEPTMGRHGKGFEGIEFESIIKFSSLLRSERGRKGFFGVRNVTSRIELLGSLSGIIKFNI
jgi:hypothetical protein